jgi:acetyl esterase/lipase
MRPGFIAALWTTLLVLPSPRRLLLVVVVVACGRLAAAPANADEPPLKAGSATDVQVVRNVAYYEGADADPVRHRLDLYLPRGRKDFPVVFFIHGGAWLHGNKNHFGIYAGLGRCFAKHGIGMVSTNYRLSPAVKHPEHVRDVARAFAWTHKNIAKYGGRPDEIFVAGHSAGGHLAALLTTDARYLQSHGLRPADIRGTVPVSGLYTIPNLPLLHKVFGKDPAVLRDAAPLTHVSPDLPPFLIIYSDGELPGCEGAGAEAFCRALCAKGCCATTFEATKRNHMSVLINAMNETDPVMRRMLGFVTAQVTLHRLATEGAAGVDFLAGILGR